MASLTSLQSLILFECRSLSGDLSPLASLTSLQSLNLSTCWGIRFAPLESWLPTLQKLHSFGCDLDDLPSEVCGEAYFENLLDKVRAHYQDLKSGQRIDAEVKVLFLGNGGVGKTQLCRRLRDLPFKPSIPTTRSVQVGEMTVTLERLPVRLNHGQAIFLILWTPELECQTAYQEDALSFRHRQLSYWVDYLRAFAGTDASVLSYRGQVAAESVAPSAPSTYPSLETRASVELPEHLRTEQLLKRRFDNRAELF